ncbi:phosphatidylinositol-4-phosphate 5-kinase-domain-containing protein [Xylariales sp. AK1849]|nr:phosphatidylinositol-4-phosphate 5-kinase-domain-containing protein [Xylariales sp. AK1849]
MTNRESRIAKSIVFAILNDDGPRLSILARVLGVFNFYWLTLQLVRVDLFKALRGFWAIRDNDYKSSFASDWKNGKKRHDVLQPLGDMGYSGSTFFQTSDCVYLIKSVPRHFENTFFKNELLIPYADHIRANPGSLLVRITDFLECSQRSIGTLFGLAPSHHIVMENILYDQHKSAENDNETKWETWDLKPTSYFYPERDVAGGALSTEATKSRLADEFKEKIHLTLDQAEDFKAQLQKDTKLLEDHNVVDYSLFLVRVSDSDEPTLPAQPPFAPPGPPSWRIGVPTADGKHVYRAVILDFFWAKHTAHAKAMTGLIRGYNLIDDQGPMSVTTDSTEYRERFLKMCFEFIEVEGSPDWGKS